MKNKLLIFLLVIYLNGFSQHKSLGLFINIFDLSNPISNDDIIFDEFHDHFYEKKLNFINNPKNLRVNKDGSFYENYFDTFEI